MEGKDEMRKLKEESKTVANRDMGEFVNRKRLPKRRQFRSDWPTKSSANETTKGNPEHYGA